MSTATQTETKLVLKTPSMWKIMLHNDDFTPMDFVVYVLTTIYNKSADEAERLMMTVHVEGKANVGIYTKDIALTKKSKTDELSAANNHPLLVSAEEA